MWEDLISSIISDVEFIIIDPNAITGWTEKNELIHSWPTNDENVNILKSIADRKQIIMYDNRSA